MRSTSPRTMTFRFFLFVALALVILAFVVSLWFRGAWLGLFVVALAHEAGHLVAARLTGVRTSFLSLGFLLPGVRLETEGRWRLRFSLRDLPLAPTVDMPGIDAASPWQAAWTAASGPAASVAVGLVAAWYWRAAGMDGSEYVDAAMQVWTRSNPADLVPAFTITAAAYGAASVLNLLPWKPLDGGFLWPALNSMWRSRFA